MARPLRIEYPGAYYQVSSRGNEKKAIFRDRRDRKKFLEVLGRVAEDFRLRVHAYVLMDNHYHLLAETVDGRLSQAVQYLNSVYTQHFNRRHKRIGHLFRGRYKAILIEKSPYLLELSRFIHLTPWRKKKSQNPFSYPWSSLRVFAGTARPPRWLTTKEVLAGLGNRGRRGYREFIREGMRGKTKEPWDQVTSQALIGSEKFVRGIVRRYLRAQTGKGSRTNGRSDLPRIESEKLLKELGRYYGVKGAEISLRSHRYTAARYVGSYLLKKHCALKLREIGERLGLHYSSVSNAIRQVRERPTREMTRAIREIEEWIRVKERRAAA